MAPLRAAAGPRRLRRPVPARGRDLDGTADRRHPASRRGAGDHFVLRARWLGHPPPACRARLVPRVDQANERVTISCQVSDIDIVWQLAEAGTGTSINVNVSLPEREAYRLDGQQNVISESLRRLTALAEAAS